MQLRRSGEDYLETILVLQMKYGSVRSLDVADTLNVTRPSVSNAIRRLQDGGYLVMNKDKTLVLTDTGHEVASRVYERHCVLKNGLVSLGVDPEVAERDACGIEHLISDETFEIIKRLWMERRAQ